MIVDSVPWKGLLSRKAAVLAKKRDQRRWTSASIAALEQDIMLSAYAVRKLLEAHKISDEFVRTPVAAAAYSFKGERRHFVESGDLPDFFNWHDLDEFYDLEAPESVQVPLREFCNQLVHSWIFMLVRAEDGGMDGYFAASDHGRARRLLYFGLVETADILRGVAEDDIAHSVMDRDPATGQWRFLVRSRRPRSTPDG